MRNNIVVRMLNDESGATAIEYGLIVALVSMAAIGAYTALGTEIQEFFTAMQGTLEAATPGGGGGGGGGGS
jgi:pilus assembly protein Flp/PilA